jgi:hypothetical protein
MSFFIQQVWLVPPDKRRCTKQRLGEFKINKDNPAAAGSSAGLTHSTTLHRKIPGMKTGEGTKFFETIVEIEAL